MKFNIRRRNLLFAALTLVAVTAPGFFLMKAFSEYQSAVADTTRAELLSGRIMLLDEVLTMSARTGAATGEARWVERYETNVPLLSDAIQGMLDLAADPGVEAMVQRTDAANLALIEMETQALALAQQGRTRQAYALVMSPEYEAQKEIYAAGMNEAIVAVRARFAEQTRNTWWGLKTAAVLSIVGVCLSMGVWMYIVEQGWHARERLTAALRRERDAASAANAAKSQFLANMSHELRTPLHAIVGYSELMREGAAEQQRVGDAADHDRVLGASRHLLAMIDGLIDLSHAEANDLRVHVAAFEVRPLLEDVVAEYASAAKERGNMLSAHFADDLGVAENDGARMRQCLAHMLSNAVKFTEHGEISVRATRESEAGRHWIVCEVADTGAGIPDERQQRLFAPLSNLGGVTAFAHDGAGVGLSLTHSLAGLLGGSVAVRSAEGEGSVFTLRVPAALA
jgi:signal transduction histidine kinase